MLVSHSPYGGGDEIRLRRLASHHYVRCGLYRAYTDPAASSSEGNSDFRADADANRHSPSDADAYSNGRANVHAHPGTGILGGPSD